jgi:hypothetical protein
LENIPRNQAELLEESPCQKTALQKGRFFMRKYYYLQNYGMKDLLSFVTSQNVATAEEKEIIILLS